MHPLIFIQTLSISIVKHQGFMNTNTNNWQYDNVRPNSANFGNGTQQYPSSTFWNFGNTANFGYGTQQYPSKAFFQPRYYTHFHANAFPTTNHAFGSTYPAAAPSNERNATESFVITFTPQEEVTFLQRAKNMHLAIISRQCCGPLTPLAENLRVRLPRDWDAGP